MTRVVQRVFELARRVRDFCRAHLSTDPGYVIILGRLEETLTRAEGIAARQHNGLAGARGARELRDELRRALQQELVRYLVAVGGVVAKERAELAAKFRLPKFHASNQVFLVTVKALLADAESQRELMVKEGMSATLLEDFAKAVAELEAASEAAISARRDHMGARVDLELITADLVELVKVLDGVNRYRFRKDPQLKAEWDVVKSISFKSKPDVVVPPSEGGATAAA